MQAENPDEHKENITENQAVNAVPEAGDVNADSRQAQAHQDAQAAANREEEENAARQEKSWHDRLKDAGASFMGVKTINGVRVFDDEIDLYTRRHKPVTPEQLQTVIKQAVEKGWTEIYAYKRNGKPDAALMQQLNIQIVALGLQDKISIGRDPAILGKNLREAKSLCRKLAAGAAVGAAAAGAAALAQQLIPQ